VCGQKEKTTRSGTLSIAPLSPKTQASAGQTKGLKWVSGEEDLAAWGLRLLHASQGCKGGGERSGRNLKDLPEGERGEGSRS